MTRDELLDEVEALGLPAAPAHAVAQAEEYLELQGEDSSPEAVLALLQRLQQGQERMAVQAEQHQRPLGEWDLCGALEPARCAMTRRRGEAPGSFKRAFPSLWPKIGRYVGGRAVDPAALDGVPSRGLLVFEQAWMADERASDLPSIILLVGVSHAILPPHLRYAAAASVTQSSRHSGHPVIDQPGILTLGWVRLVHTPQALLVEEVQSDWLSARSRWATASARVRAVAPAGTGEVIESVCANFDELLPDLLGAAFRYACELGIPTVQMIGWEARCSLSVSGAPPRSVYDRLPRQLGMKARKGSPLALPILQSTRFWTLSV